MTYKYKVRGKLQGSTAIREISFDNGVLTGDTMFLFQVKRLAGLYELDGDFQNGYTPEGSFAEDALAVLFIAEELCTEIKVSGSYPKWDATVEEGVIY